VIGNNREDTTRNKVALFIGEYQSDGVNVPISKPRLIKSSNENKKKMIAKRNRVVFFANFAEEIRTYDYTI
jgi:hypothetical protein